MPILLNEGIIFCLINDAEIFIPLVALKNSNYFSKKFFYKLKTLGGDEINLIQLFYFFMPNYIEEIYNTNNGISRR
jgi:hypothetical protein